MSDKRSTRDRILDTVEDLLIDRGAGDVTLDDVIAHAGVSKGGLLYHFQSKADLFAGLMQRLVDVTRTEMRKAPSEPADLIRWYLTIPTPAEIEETRFFRSMIAGIRANDPGDDGMRIAQLLDEYAQPLARLPKLTADLTRLAGDGLYLGAMLGATTPDRANLELIIEMLIATLDQG